MKTEGQTPHSLLAIVGEASYTRSMLLLLTSHYFNVAWIIMGVQSRQMVCRYYRNGEKIWEINFSHKFLKNKRLYWLVFPISFTIEYFSPIFLGILVSLKMHVRFDVCIGEFYTGAFNGLFLRKIGLVNKVAYYVSDWFPYLPRSKLPLMKYIMNSIAFPYLDRFCATRADATWNFTQRIIEERHNRWKNHSLIIPREEVISPPIAWRKTDDDENGSHRKSIGFLGVLRKGQGLELAIEAIADLKKKGTYLNLEIIGTSSFETYYKDYATNLSVEDQIVFHGFVENEIKVAKILQRCICGLALYEVGKENYTYYTWPSKVGFYLECGIPVIITKSAIIADEIEKEKFGIVVKPDSESISDAIYNLNNDNNLLKEFKDNIKRFVQSSSLGNEMKNALIRLCK